MDLSPYLVPLEDENAECEQFTLPRNLDETWARQFLAGCQALEAGQTFEKGCIIIRHEYGRTVLDVLARAFRLCTFRHVLFCFCFSTRSEEEVATSVVSICECIACNTIRSFRYLERKSTLLQHVLYGLENSTHKEKPFKFRCSVGNDDSFVEKITQFCRTDKMRDGILCLSRVASPYLTVVRKLLTELARTSSLQSITLRQASGVFWEPGTGQRPYKKKEIQDFTSRLLEALRGNDSLIDFWYDFPEPLLAQVEAILERNKRLRHIKTVTQSKTLMEAATLGKYLGKFNSGQQNLDASLTPTYELLRRFYLPFAPQSSMGTGTKRRRLE